MADFGSAVQIPIVQTFADVGTSSGIILAANDDRNWAFLQNQSAVDIWLAFGKDAVINECIRIPPQPGAYEISYVLMNMTKQALHAIAGTASNRITMAEH